MVTCVTLHNTKYIIIISYIFEDNSSVTSCNTIIHKIYLLHLSGAFLHQGNKILGLEKPGTGTVVSLDIFSWFMELCVAECGVLHI